MRRLLFILPVLLFFLPGCSGRVETVSVDFNKTVIIICDPENYLQTPYFKSIISEMRKTFSQMLILSEFISDKTVDVIIKEIDRIQEDEVCIFMLITGSSRVLLSSEWNLWMPDLWRSLDCKGKILLADAPWGDEFLNPLKTGKPETVWVVNGRLGYLRRKLPKSLLAASCRFDEVNIRSRGIDGQTRLPLFSWYFLDLLNKKMLQDSDKTEIVQIINEAVELTATARSRGIVNELEETLFFNNSEIEREEYRTFPHPVIWNGLADHIFPEEPQ